MNTVAQTNEETAALALLKSTKLSLLEAAQVACAATASPATRRLHSQTFLGVVSIPADGEVKAAR